VWVGVAGGGAEPTRNWGGTAPGGSPKGN